MLSLKRCSRTELNIQLVILNNMKYSKYFIKCMLWSIVSLIIASAAYHMQSSGACAIFTIMAFVAWFAGVMAPVEEKYRGGSGE